jgi:O-antigen/teichoic acid export membrane protein
VKFFYSVGYYTLGNIIVSGAGFALIPFMTRLLNVNDLGLVYLFQSIMVLFSALIALGGQSVIQSLYHKELNRIPLYIGGSLFNSFLMLIVVSVISITFGKEVFEGLGFDVVYVQIAILLAFLLFIQSMAHTLLQIREEAKTYFFMVSFSSVVGFFVTIVLLIYFYQTWQVRIIGISSALLVSSIFSIFVIYRIGVAIPGRVDVKKLLSIGHPVVVHSFAMLFINQTDKFLLAHLKTATDVGEYGVVAQLASVVYLFGSTLSMAYTPIFYKNIDSKDKRLYIVKIRRYCMIGSSIFGGLVLMLIINFNNLIVGREFNFHNQPFVILILSYIVFSWYFLYVGYFYHFKNTKLLAILTSSIAVLNIITSYLLIPEYGLTGAAIGTLFSYIIGLFVAMLFAKYKTKSII